jgi:hypothetical protein
MSGGENKAPKIKQAITLTLLLFKKVVMFTRSKNRSVSNKTGT